MPAPPLHSKQTTMKAGYTVSHNLNNDSLGGNSTHAIQYNFSSLGEVSTRYCTSEKEFNEAIGIVGVLENIVAIFKIKPKQHIQ